MDPDDVNDIVPLLPQLQDHDFLLEGLLLSPEAPSEAAVASDPLQVAVEIESTTPSPVMISLDEERPPGDAWQWVMDMDTRDTQKAASVEQKAFQTLRDQTRDRLLDSIDSAALIPQESLKKSTESGVSLLDISLDLISEPIGKKATESAVSLLDTTLDLIPEETTEKKATESVSLLDTTLDLISVPVDKKATESVSLLDISLDLIPRETTSALDSGSIEKQVSSTSLNVTLADFDTKEMEYPNDYRKAIESVTQESKTSMTADSSLVSAPVPEMSTLAMDPPQVQNDQQDIMERLLQEALDLMPSTFGGEDPLLSLNFTERWNVYGAPASSTGTLLSKDIPNQSQSMSSCLSVKSVSSEKETNASREPAVDPVHPSTLFTMAGMGMPNNTTTPSIFTTTATTISSSRVSATGSGSSLHGSPEKRRLEDPHVAALRRRPSRLRSPNRIQSAFRPVDLSKTSSQVPHPEWPSSYTSALASEEGVREEEQRRSLLQKQDQSKLSSALVKSASMDQVIPSSQSVPVTPKKSEIQTSYRSIQPSPARLDSRISAPSTPRVAKSPFESASTPGTTLNRTPSLHRSKLPVSNVPSPAVASRPTSVYDDGIGKRMKDEKSCSLIRSKTLTSIRSPARSFPANDMDTRMTNPSSSIAALNPSGSVASNPSTRIPLLKSSGLPVRSATVVRRVPVTNERPTPTEGGEKHRRPVLKASWSPFQKWKQPSASQLGTGEGPKQEVVGSFLSSMTSSVSSPSQSPSSKSVTRLGLLSRFSKLKVAPSSPLK